MVTGRLFGNAVKSLIRSGRVSVKNPQKLIKSNVASEIIGKSSYIAFENGEPVAIVEKGSSRGYRLTKVGDYYTVGLCDPEKFLNCPILYINKKVIYALVGFPYLDEAILNHIRIDENGRKSILFPAKVRKLDSICYVGNGSFVVKAGRSSLIYDISGDPRRIYKDWMLGILRHRELIRLEPKVRVEVQPIPKHDVAFKLEGIDLKLWKVYKKFNVSPVFYANTVRKRNYRFELTFVEPFLAPAMYVFHEETSFGVLLTDVVGGKPVITQFLTTIRFGFGVKEKWTVKVSRVEAKNVRIKRV